MQYRWSLFCCVTFVVYNILKPGCFLNFRWVHMTFYCIGSSFFYVKKANCAINDHLMLSVTFKHPSLPLFLLLPLCRCLWHRKHAWLLLHLGWNVMFSPWDRSRTSTSWGSLRTWQLRRGCCSGPSRSQTATWGYGATTSQPPGGTGGYSMPSFIDTGTQTAH